MSILLQAIKGNMATKKILPLVHLLNPPPQTYIDIHSSRRLQNYYLNFEEANLQWERENRLLTATTWKIPTQISLVHSSDLHNEGWTRWSWREFSMKTWCKRLYDACTLGLTEYRIGSSSTGDYLLGKYQNPLAARRKDAKQSNGREPRMDLCVEHHGTTGTVPSLARYKTSMRCHNTHGDRHPRGNLLRVQSPGRMHYTLTAQGFGVYKPQIAKTSTPSL